MNLSFSTEYNIFYSFKFLRKVTRPIYAFRYTITLSFQPKYRHTIFSGTHTHTNIRPLITRLHLISLYTGPRRCFIAGAYAIYINAQYLHNNIYNTYICICIQYQRYYYYLIDTEFSVCAENLAIAAMPADRNERQQAMEITHDPPRPCVNCPTSRKSKRRRHS